MKRWEWKVSKEFKVNKSWKAKNGEKLKMVKSYIDSWLARLFAKKEIFMKRLKRLKRWKGLRAFLCRVHQPKVSKYQNKNKVRWLTKGKIYRKADILIICWVEWVLYVIFDIWRLMFLKTTVKINLHLALSLSLSGIQFSQNVKSNYANI